MQSNITQLKPMQPRLRAIIEFVDGELKIYPIAQSDREARDILDAFGFLREDLPG